MRDVGNFSVSRVSLFRLSAALQLAQSPNPGYGARMGNLIYVMAGGALGAGARHLVGAAMLARLGPCYPWGTLAVNLVGGLLMGLLVGVTARTGASEHFRLLLGVGVLGGFTTFSAFSLESWGMIETGQMLVALGYIGASVVGAIAALGLGLWMARA
jgi:fluoride exporter